MKLLKGRLLGATVALLAGISPALAADVLKHDTSVAFTSLNIDSDAVDRLQLVDQLPTLTQRVAAASCALNAGFGAEENRAILKESVRDFGTVIRALKFGNSHININGAEHDRQLLDEVDLVWDAWSYTKRAIYGQLAGRDDAENAALIAAHSKALLSMTSALATDYYGHYVTPFEIKQADAMALAIAARQGQLTQNLALAVCESVAAQGDVDAAGPIEETIEIFEASFLALRGGLAEVGLTAAPTPRISQALARRADSWEAIKSRFFNQDALATLEEREAQALLSALDLELQEITNLVGYYADFAARHH